MSFEKKIPEKKFEKSILSYASDELESLSIKQLKELLSQVSDHERNEAELAAESYPRELMTCDCKDLSDCKHNKQITFPDGKVMETIPFESVFGETSCHDCSCSVGKHHHPGCDSEICPRCEQQFMSCNCLADKAYKEKLALHEHIEEIELIYWGKLIEESEREKKE